MFDEKYMKEGGKEFESLVEALLVLRCCSGFSCRECYRNMFRDVGTMRGGEEACGVHHKARDYITKITGKNCDNDRELVISSYELIMNKAPKVEIKEEGDKTCANCLHSQMHTSGIRFCHSFGNFVHEDGFCYRWKSDKIEVETACG